MNAVESLCVVRSLANGVDPASGEVFPASSPYQRADTVRALYQAAVALEKLAQSERRRGNAPGNSGKPWTEDEDRRLLAAFDAGRGLSEIAVSHDRTQAGVRARLVKYGRLAA